MQLQEMGGLARDLFDLELVPRQRTLPTTPSAGCYDVHGHPSEQQGRGVDVPKILQPNAAKWRAWVLLVVLVDQLG